MMYFHASQAGGNPPANKGYVGSTSYSEFEPIVVGPRLQSRHRELLAVGAT